MDLHAGWLPCRFDNAVQGEQQNTACKQRQGYTLAGLDSVAHKQNLNRKMVEGQEDKQGNGLQGKENGMS